MGYTHSDSRKAWRRSSRQGDGLYRLYVHLDRNHDFHPRGRVCGPGIGNIGFVYFLESCP